MNGSDSQQLDIVTVVILAVGALALSLWGGAVLACYLAGTPTHISLTTSLGAGLSLLSHLGDPAAAWPEPTRTALPGPILYWICTVVAGGAVAVVPGLIAWHRFHLGVGSKRRRRLGVDTRARFATRRDLRPLTVGAPTAGRLVLGKVNGRLVATENRAVATHLSRSARKRRGDRNGVAIIGPTRCGKTSNLITSIREWTGPAILSSVMDDLMAQTLTQRAALGEVKIFDPVGVTGRPSASWSPLQFAGTVTGAQRATRALADCAPRGGAENMDFFSAKAETLMWPLLYAAAVSKRSMTDVIQWVQTMDRPSAEDKGQVAPILEAQSRSLDPDARRQGQAAARAIASIWALDERTRSAIYATAQTVVQAWEDPAICQATETSDIDLDWLTSGNNTLYVSAPLHDQKRLQAVLGGLIGDLVKQAYERVARTSAPLPSTLLLVMDEAGNTPAKWLPEVASTCAGVGMLLVTVWQSKSQIEANYGRLTDSVLTNHGTKILYSGISDPATLDYASRLLGDEEVRQVALSGAVGAQASSINESTTRLPLVPGDVIRQTRPGEALLIHGTLRPAHLRSRPYFHTHRSLHQRTANLLTAARAVISHRQEHRKHNNDE